MGKPSSGEDSEIDQFPGVTCLCLYLATLIMRHPKSSIFPAKDCGIKSLKLYLNSYRDLYISMKRAPTGIFDELKKKLKPSSLNVGD